MPFNQWSPDQADAANSFANALDPNRNQPSTLDAIQAKMNALKQMLAGSEDKRNLSQVAQNYFQNQMNNK
jgi:hypothetical protein